MAFKNGTNHDITEQARPRGNYRPAAVLCWFTSQGDAQPLKVKIEDDNGMILRIDHIHVLTKEEQHYAGITNIKFKCSAVIENMQKEFILLYCPEDCTWKMVC